MQNFAFSSYVDNSRKYLIQGFIWAMSLKHITGINSSNIYLCLNEKIEREVIDFYIASGVKRENIFFGKTISEESLPINKINQIDHFKNKNFSKIIFSDTDMIFQDNFLDWLGYQYAIGANMFVSRPPMKIFKSLMSKFNIAKRRSYVFGAIDKNDYPMTLANNIIGSVYVIDGKKYDEICNSWKDYCYKCLKNISLINGFERNIDQIAMTLALEDLDILATRLCQEVNIGPNVDFLRPAPKDEFKYGFMFYGYHFHDFLSLDTGLVEHSQKSHKAIKEFVADINKMLNEKKVADFIALLNKLEK